MASKLLGLPQKIAQQDFVGRGGTTEHNARRRLRRRVKSEVCADESIAHYTSSRSLAGSARLLYSKITEQAKPYFCAAQPNLHIPVPQRVKSAHLKRCALKIAPMRAAPSNSLKISAAPAEIFVNIITISSSGRGRTRNLSMTRSRHSTCLRKYGRTLY